MLIEEEERKGDREQGKGETIREGNEIKKELGKGIESKVRTEQGKERYTKKRCRT